MALFEDVASLYEENEKLKSARHDDAKRIRRLINKNKFLKKDRLKIKEDRARIVRKWFSYLSRENLAIADCNRELEKFYKAGFFKRLRYLFTGEMED